MISTEIKMGGGTMTYDDFSRQYPRYAKFNIQQSAKELFVFLSQPEIIDRMITVNDHTELSALNGITNELSQRFSVTKDFNLKEDLNSRQMIGAMIKFILEPFGYIALPENRVSVKNSDIFHLSMRYTFIPERQKQKLAKQYRIVDKDDPCTGASK